MSDPEVEDFLAHYGVKGMSWGTRKSSSGGVKKAKSASQLSKEKKIRKARIEKAKVFTSRAVLAAIVISIVAPGLISTVGKGATHVARAGVDQAVMRKQASNAAKAAAIFMSDNRGLHAMRIIDI